MTVIMYLVVFIYMISRSVQTREAYQETQTAYQKFSGGGRGWQTSRGGTAIQNTVMLNFSPKITTTATHTLSFSLWIQRNAFGGRVHGPTGGAHSAPQIHSWFWGGRPPEEGRTGRERGRGVWGALRVHYTREMCAIRSPARYRTLTT